MNQRLSFDLCQMYHITLTIAAFLLVLQSPLAAFGQPDRTGPGPEVIRIATFNIEDVRIEDVRAESHPRLSRIAETIRKIDPDVILLNEIAIDSAGTAGIFVDRYLNQDEGGRTYRVFTPASNTGIASGFDLDRNGSVARVAPDLPPSTPESPGAQTSEGRNFGGDAWGFGMFPGQYAMALLVSDEHEILADDIRSFRTFPWASLPDARRPVDPSTGEPWYPDEVWSEFRLSSKTHVDVPVRTPSGAVVHILASHPTPPAFDGPEDRNKLRNHDEIRFWKLYLDDSAAIVDDSGQAGGLPAGAHFVIAGDLNADPDEGSSIDDPIGTYLLQHPRVNGDFTPVARTPVEGLDPDDTAGWGLRVDYVLPSATLGLLDGAVVRDEAGGREAPSDHFPVWVDVAIGDTGRASSTNESRLCGGDAPSLVVLGIAQDAGYPQAGTKSSPAFDDFSRRRFATSLAVLDPVDGTRWLFEATPDFKDQLHGLDTLTARPDIPGIDGIFVTHAHIGHYAGLIHVGHEVIGADGVPVYAMPRMTEFLSTNGPWDQLVRYGNIELRELAADSTTILNPRLRVTPFLVPHRDEYSETVGYFIEGPNRRVAFIPDINKWRLLDEQGRSIEEIVEQTDVALVDATFFSSDEVGGRDMSEFPHPFVVETMSRFADADPEIRSRIHLIHMNHTNPLLDPASPETSEVLVRGFRIAREGQCIGL